MALIKCPECGHEISEFADKCISCGCPMSKIKELMSSTHTPLHSKSATYQKLSSNDKSLLNELCDFIVTHTSLIMIDHSKNFGFRKRGTIKMVIVFRYSNSGKTLFIVFKTKTEFPSNKIRVKQSNIGLIKEAILKYFSNSPLASTKRIEINDDEPIEKTKPISFTSTRSDRDNYLIKTFEEELKLRIDGLIIKNSPYMYTFRISKGEELFTLCWFANGDKNKLAFKYYLRPLDREPQKVLYPLSRDAGALADTIYKIYSNLSISVIDKTSDQRTTNNTFTENTEQDRTPSIYGLIVKALNDKPMKGNDDITKVCIEVKSFVLSEIMRKSIEENYFENEEEFYNYKYSYRFVPNFFGYTFSIKNISIKDAKVFYRYYKAIKVIEIIKKYERIYNEVIIQDHSSVLNDLQKMVCSNEIDFNSVKGLTSSFVLVPIDVLNDCLDKLNSFEELY